MSSAKFETIIDEMRSLVQSGDYPLILRRSAELAEGVRGASATADGCRRLDEFAAESAVKAMVAIETLAVLDGRMADDLLVDLVSHRNEAVRRHAAWRLGDRQPSSRALPILIDMVTIGGIDTMHAHRALRSWVAGASSTIAPDVVRIAVTRFVVSSDPAARARLVDLLGALGHEADDVLLCVAGDVDEHDTVRSAAIGALGERTADHNRFDAITLVLQDLATYDDDLGTDAALALSARVTAPAGQSNAERRPVGKEGLRVAQLVLAGGLDGQLSLGGRGDTGGVASLLVSLGEALAHRDDVDHVLTIGRGSSSDALTGPLSSSRISLTYGTIAFGDVMRRATTANDSWEHLPAIERGLRRVLRLAGPIDVLHLRMADAGTLAGATVASEDGIPVCFSVAPDPHNVLESMQSQGVLDDESFLRLDAESHLWFRARLIERVARDAERLALFPRSAPMRGIDVTQARCESQRVAVVAEGIDISLLDRAVGHHDVLDELFASLPEARRHLPLLLSVGRLNPVKGMDRVVAAWAGDADLNETCNLVIVGGDLEAPSTVESAVLGSIDQILPKTDRRRRGLVLMGGRPRADVAALMVYAAARGVYVDGAIKEEFGLAVLEAMAAGLVVVAPSTGGPSTYVDDGDTGILVAPSDDLGVAISEAFGLVDRAGRVERARAIVDSRYSITTMAAKLVELYLPAMAVR